MLENFGSVRDQMPPSGVLCLLKLPQQAKSLTLNLLKFNPERRPSAEVALQDVFLEKFFLQEAEPVCDKVIRMPIADMTKLKASDYRAVGLVRQLQGPDIHHDCPTSEDGPGGGCGCTGARSCEAQLAKAELSIFGCFHKQPQRWTTALVEPRGRCCCATMHSKVRRIFNTANLYERMSHLSKETLRGTAHRLRIRATSEV